MSSRLVHLARLIAAGAPYEWTEIAGRTAMRVTHEGASQISVLTEDEARELTQLIADPTGRDVPDPNFGAWIFDAMSRSYSASVEQDGVVLRYTLRGEETTPRIARADEHRRSAKTLIQEACHIAADKLLQKANEWAKSNDPPVYYTHESFIARMTIDTIEVDADRFIYYFDDGDLFWGHSIIVTVLDDGTTDAEFAG